MILRDEQEIPNLVDRAAQALRNASIPDGPPADLVSSTVDALLSARCRPGTPRPSERRSSTFLIARYSTVAAAIIVSAVLAGWLFLKDHAAGPAFADVVEQVKHAKSVTFVAMVKPTQKSAIMEEKFYIQGDAFRMELIGAEDTPVPVHEPPVWLAIIADAKQKKALELDFDRKIARAIRGDEGVWQEMAKGLANPIEQLRQLKDQDAEKIGEEVLDGRKTQVYRLKKADIIGLRLTGPEVAKVWVDVKTRLPVRIAIERASADGKVDAAFSFDHFGWNESFDPDLFKQEVPKGFSSKKGKRAQLRRSLVI
jgi:hypothetical protein